MIVPRYTREIPQRFRLEAGKCSNCGFLAFPPRKICPQCSGREFTTVQLKAEGTILSYTVIHTPADTFSVEAPFVVGIIETTDGGRLTAQIVDCNSSEVDIGKKVRLMLRRIQKEGHSGILQYGYKAVLER